MGCLSPPRVHSGRAFFRAGGTGLAAPAEAQAVNAGTRQAAKRPNAKNRNDFL